MAEALYYIDRNGNNYVNVNGDYFIAGSSFSEPPTKLHYIRYKPYFYNSSNSFKGYTAFIRQADGTYLKLKPYIYTNIEVAIAGLATAGVSRAGGAVI